MWLGRWQGDRQNFPFPQYFPQSDVFSTIFIATGWRCGVIDKMMLKEARWGQRWLDTWGRCWEKSGSTVLCACSHSHSSAQPAALLLALLPLTFWGDPASVPDEQSFRVECHSAASILGNSPALARDGMVCPGKGTWGMFKQGKMKI